MNLVWLDISASYSHSSLALPAIEACRCGDAHNWSVVRGTINSDIFPIVEQLHRAKPDMIASTLWLFNHECVMKICQRIKALLPEITIILGGPQFNGDNEEFLRSNGYIDYLFRGEGEIEFQRFIAGEDTQKISGLCYIDNCDTYIDNGMARVADFAALPAPESSSFFNFDSPFVQVESSRGCFNSCAFCVSGGDRPVRTKPIEELRERIDYIRNRGVSDIRVLDRTFNYSPTRAAQMLSLFTNYPTMNFHLEIHPALLTPTLCEQLESMPHGLLHLEAGMQSLDDKVIEACQRIGSNEMAIAGLERLCSMSNFETHTDLIAGLPRYTLQQIFDDVRRLSELGAGEIQLELLKLLPGTKMRREASHHGIRYALTPPYEVLETPDISTSELNKARLLSKLLDKFYNAKGWQSVTRQIINEREEFLPEFLAFLTALELLEKPLSLERRGELLYEFCSERMQGCYTDEISMAWIENGISLRKPQAGRIEKATELPEGLDRINGVHYYLWQGREKSYIYGFDRATNHSYPTIKVELTR